MLPEDRFFRTRTQEDLWQRYCGFLELPVGEFMEIQRYLLQEQMKLIAGTPLGKGIMNGNTPATVEEFRRLVPITSYEHYAPYIGQCQEEALAEKPLFWCHTAGRGGNFKWIPYSRAAFDRIARHGVAVGILAAAERKGEVNFTPGAKVLVNLAPRPYASGSLLYHFAEYFSYRLIPPLAVAEEQDFRKRTELAFRMALRQGVDCIFSLSTALVKIGESFTDKERKLKLAPVIADPIMLLRLIRGWLRSRFAGRPMLPRDLWSPKALVTFGVDTSIYQDELARLWGKNPYQVYGTTEILIGAVQSWNKKGLTFLPDVAFWEFIPEEERRRSLENPEYQPATVLLDELEVGKRYELVLTHFHGMPLLRYRIGDIFQVLAPGDEEIGVKLPQVVFQARASDIIDLAGLTQLDEKTIWQAIVSTEVKYDDWCARKEYDRGWGYLHLFIEPKGNPDAQELERLIELRLRVVDVDYRDLEGWLGQERAVKVTLLSGGTFNRYYEEQVKAAVPLAQLKPPHINPPQEVVAKLLQLSGNGR